MTIIARDVFRISYRNDSSPYHRPNRQ